MLYHIYDVDNVKKERICREMMLEIIEKIIVRIKSLVFYYMMKIRYRNRIHMKHINSMRNYVNFFIDKDSSIRLGRSISLLGPTYFKSILGGRIEIGDYCFFNRNCSVTSLGKIKIGSNCKFANNLVIVDHDHNIYSNQKISPYTIKDVLIEDDVWVGANVTILKGVTIGKGSVIAAGSVVAHDVPEYTLVAGVPAKFMKEIKHKE